MYNFAGDTRITTTIEENGVRAVGTKAQSKVVDTVIGKGQNYSGPVNILGKPYETIYVPIKDNSGNNIGMFFIGIGQSAILKEVRTILYRVTLFSAVIILISSLLIFILAQKVIINPIKYINRHFQQLSTGDFSQEVEESYLKRADEFGDMCKSAQLMQDSLKKMIASISNSSRNIDNEAQTLASIASNMATSSHAVAASIEQVASGAVEQSENFQSNVQSLDKFGVELDKIVKAVEDINATTENVGIMVKESNEKMQSLIKSISGIQTSFENYMKTINEFKQNVAQINDISKLISGISDQTNLLALNASIEAASAGEAGRGFAVVASEIRKLAEQSKKSVSSINALIQAISENTAAMTTKSDAVGNELEKQINSIYETIESFNKIIGEVEVIVPRVNKVSTSIENMDSEKNMILKNIERTALIASEFSASTEEIFAASEEMSTSTEEVSSASKKLSSMTKHIMEQIQEFKI